MKTRPSAHLPPVAGLGLGAMWLAASTSALAQPEPPPSEHRFEAAGRLGVMLPGELSPVNWYRTEAKAAPSLWVDVGYVAHPFFSIGPYLKFTPFAFERMSGSDVIGEGDGSFASLGAAAKARFVTSETLTLRAGLTLGYNIVSYEGTNENGSSFELSGTGINIGLMADASLRVAPTVGVSAQLAFLSQVSGSADVSGPPTNITAEGETRDFGFSPIFFLTVGPELYF